MSATGSESVLVWSQLWKMEAVRRPAASDQGLCIAQSEEAQVRSTFHAPALALFVIHFLVNAKVCPCLAEGQSQYRWANTGVNYKMLHPVEAGPCLTLKWAYCAAGAPESHSRQLLASPSLQGCASLSWQCQVNATQASIAPEVYDLVRAAPQNCTALSSTMLCGSYLLDMGLYNAITAGACQLGCTSSAAPGCSVPPAPALPYSAFKAVLPAGQTVLAPAAVPAPAPAPAPACPPKPQPGCARSEHVCGAQKQYRISDAQFSALNAAHTCAADLDVSFCIVGRCSPSKRKLMKK